MTADIELLPLPAETEGNPWIGYKLWGVRKLQDYARANVAHATAPLQAEIKAPQAEVADLFGQLLACQHELDAAEARAERLEESLRSISELDEREGNSLGNARSIARAALGQEGNSG